jgi:hypothetical protein
MFFWARPFFSSPRSAHVFQAWPMRPLSLWPFSPLTRRPTPLRRGRSELRPRAAAAPRVPSAVSLGWTPSSPSFLSFPGCLSIFPLFFCMVQRRACPIVTMPAVAASLSVAWTSPFLCRMATNQTRPPLSFPHMGSRQPPLSSLAATPCLAASQSPARAPPPPSRGTSMPEPHNHAHDRRAPNPCVTSFCRCRSQSSPSSSKSPEPPSVVLVLRAGPLPVLCTPPAMALSDCPSDPLAPP